MNAQLRALTKGDVTKETEVLALYTHRALTELNAQAKEYKDFNATMVKIWREQMALLGVIDAGALYRSTVGVSLTADGKFTSITLEQSFNTYGLFVDYGTGSNTYRSNPGDIGRDNKRKHRRWFSRKYFASVMNIQEFYADSLGKEFCRAISKALLPSFGRFAQAKNPDIMRRSVTF